MKEKREGDRGFEIKAMRSLEFGAAEAGQGRVQDRRRWTGGTLLSMVAESDAGGCSCRGDYRRGERIDPAEGHSSTPTTLRIQVDR